jgi:site-specific recombinase XerD
MDFKTYLESKNYRSPTIKEHLASVKRFMKWLDAKGLDPQTLLKKDLLYYIQSCQERGVGKSSINLHLHSIEQYFMHLRGKENNPAKGLRLKNKSHKVLRDILEVKDLENLYRNYQNKPEWSFSKGARSRKMHLRNTVILGLWVYQGVRKQELQNLEKAHVNLVKGSIYIPSSHRSNSRTLPLKAEQIIPFQAYMSSLAPQQEVLFSKNMGLMIEYLVDILQKEDLKFKSYQQVRNSVLVNWLKQYNSREVQYMAGHKYISSIEKYQEEDLSDLQQAIAKFHPLN